jgi:hypothetical protein
MRTFLVLARRACLVSAALLGILCGLAPTPSSATTYTYTDSNGSDIVPGFSFTTSLSGAQLDNLSSGTSITSTVSPALTFQPNGVPQQDNAGFAVGQNNVQGTATVLIGTNASGHITSWTIGEQYFASYPAFPGENPDDFYCVWTVSTTASGDAYSLTTDNDAGFCPTGPTSNAGTFGASPPTITSAASTTFIVGTSGTFTVTTTGSPATITETGTLPTGVSFTNNGNGTATLAGKPAAATGGNYPLTITANNGVSPNASQSFTLTVDQAPAITSASSTTFQVGVSGTFTVTTAGFPIPTTITKTGALPTGVSFTNNGNGTATLSGPPAAATGGSYPITITASNGVGSNASQSFTLTVQLPTVTSLSPNGGLPSGGTSVTIKGTNFTGATAVTFGPKAATAFTVNSAVQITATSPSGSGTVDVTVTTGSGTSATSAADHFTYASPRMTQQGPKLVGSHASGNAQQGTSVSLSADGNTAIVGGPADNSDAGAAWIFSRNSALPVVPGSVGAPASSVTPAAWTQAGAKLVGAGARGAAQQGYAVALSGDGNTAIVGGYKDNSGVGAVWIFTRDGGSLGPRPAPGALLPGQWSQQGGKLIADNETGAGMFGVSVALSTDGDTAIIGGSADSSSTGAAWIFTRSHGVWSEQAKLVGTGAVGNALQGTAVALSGDGNTALVGGYGDNTDNGAAWVFVRSGTTWTQQGLKLLGSGNVGAAEQGYAVALSADGNTALVGGFADNADTGAGWIFSRSGGAWTQVGSKLVGTGAVGAASQGFSVALSADASTAAIAGYEDNAFDGAVWVFTQSGGTWTQFGSKLLGSGAVGAAEQGSALALSANGTTLLEGGAFDNSGAGAAWVFVANGAGALTATPNAGQGPLAVTFSASGLTPPMTYTVNFGDGTVGALTQGSCTGTAAAGGAGGTQCAGSASHTYTSAGSDTATLLNASGVPVGAATIAVGNNGVAQPLVGSPLH